jgi:murein DD-endopeptidase MepM/ murein hydrolase activator NlpD
MKFFCRAVAAVLAVLSIDARACDTGGDNLVHPARGAIYRKFGYVKHPLLNVTRLHSGLDYRGKTGARIVAAEAGTVVVAGREGGYGNYVRIYHGNGLHTAYAHLRRIKVKPGQCVAKGETIGSIGHTGIAVGPHLHFEIIRTTTFWIQAVCFLFADKN